jgi:hypothetical protein
MLNQSRICDKSQNLFLRQKYFAKEHGEVIFVVKILRGLERFLKYSLSYDFVPLPSGYRLRVSVTDRLRLWAYRQ